MDPLDGAMRHMQHLADMSEKQVILQKRASALELARIEGEIAVAAARAAAVDAEISKLRVKLNFVSDDEAEIHHLESLITAATAEHDARLAEIDALNSYLKIKQEMAELALEIDPSAMSNVVALLSGMTGDDPEEPSS